MKVDCVCYFLIYYFYFSELWRKENQLQHSLTLLKEDLAKADQALRSMAGKVSIQVIVFQVQMQAH